MKDAKQRLTAYNRSSEKESDAIEKKLRVHADGQERVAQANAVFKGQGTMPLTIPANALPGTIEAELAVYPNLISHVADSIEAILHRPVWLRGADDFFGVPEFAVAAIEEVRRSCQRLVWMRRRRDSCAWRT